MHPNVIPLIFAYGCPRSGTSILFQTLRQCKGVEVRKLKETFLNHPVKSRDGMITLAHQFRPRRVTFVRITRSDTDIIHSFYAAKHPAFPDKRIGAASPLQVARFLALEQINTVAQQDALPDNAGFLEVSYERFAEPETLDSLLSVVGEDNAGRLRKYLDRVWHKESVRYGEHGMVQDGHLPSLTVATPQQIEHIQKLAEAVTKQHESNDFIDTAKVE